MLKSRLSSASLASEVLKADLPQITSAEFNDFVLQKLAESKFHEIAFLIKGYALTLLKQLRLLSAQLAALAGLEVRERAPRRAGERAAREEFGLPLDQRLQQNLSRGDSNARSATPENERLRAPADLPPSEELRWDRSMRKILEEADDFGQGALLAQREESLQVPLEELLGVDEEQLRKLDEFYLPATPGKTKRKAARAEAVRRAERAIADVEKLAAVRAAFEEALNRAPAPEQLIEETETAVCEADAIFDALKGITADKELLENIERLNSASAAVEARRAATETQSLSRHGFPSITGSGDPSDRRPEAELLLEAPNLDVILETLNENPTHTHFFASLQTWPRAATLDLAPVADEARERVAAALSNGKRLALEKLVEKSAAQCAADVFVQLLEMQARGKVAIEQKHPFSLTQIYVKSINA